MTTHQPIDVAIIGGGLRAMLQPFTRARQPNDDRD